MLYRKIESFIEEQLTSADDKILIIEGARQTGKSYIIRETGKRLFPHFIELNFAEDALGEEKYKNIRTTEEFYFRLSTLAGNEMGEYGDTLIFLDEIQQYPQYLTMLKFFRQEHRFHFICSGSLLGLALRVTTSIPVGSVIRQEMHQLDFEEFLIANGMGREAIDVIRRKFEARESLDETTHEYIMKLFRRYLVTGGMPDAVNEYLATNNIMRVRQLQNSIHSLYADDAAKYEADSGRHLMIKRVYDMAVSQMENKKKRIVAKNIRDKEGDRFDNYIEEFEYLISSGITNVVSAICKPVYPLEAAWTKNLVKLYLNDTGILTSRLYGNNVEGILDDKLSVSLGAVYECVAAQELRAHGRWLFYYDNRMNGEVDFIINDYTTQSVMPIEIKSGKDYAVHSALNNLLAVPDYNVKSALVLSNDRVVRQENQIWYMPIYYVMFL